MFFDQTDSKEEKGTRFLFRAALFGSFFPLTSCLWLKFLEMRRQSSTDSCSTKFPCCRTNGSAHREQSAQRLMRKNHYAAFSSPLLLRTKRENGSAAYRKQAQSPQRSNFLLLPGGILRPCASRGVSHWCFFLVDCGRLIITKGKRVVVCTARIVAWFWVSHV